MQTVPPWVHLIPAVMIFSLGKVPAMLATVICGIPLLLRITTLAFRQVPKARPCQRSRCSASTRRRARSVAGATARVSSMKAPPQSPYTPLVLP